ncbi:hypothetical protein QR680_017323 [Steinernema hermaphroditum]|uniref:C2H2-type domain-containing protein n=1 Tax=Steinernema hermaphroditum TaxID=289476 RepID=A0AA39LNG2_9BILA|nr:hypothetical protein QR680_017323 [Steinernema hermaphroditum]
MLRMGAVDDRLEEFIHFAKFTAIVFGSSMLFFFFALALYHFGMFRRLFPDGHFTTREAPQRMSPGGDTLNTNPLLQADNKLVFEKATERKEFPQQKANGRNIVENIKTDVTPEESSITQQDSTELALPIQKTQPSTKKTTAKAQDRGQTSSDAAPTQSFKDQKEMTATEKSKMKEKMFEPMECRFRKCGLWFRDQYDLATHIEATHVVAAKEAFDEERKIRIEDEIRKTAGKGVSTASIIAENSNSFPTKIAMCIVSRTNYDIPPPTPVTRERRRIVYNLFKKPNPQTTTGLADDLEDEKHQISQLMQRISNESAAFEQKAVQQQQQQQQAAMRYANYQQQHMQQPMSSTQSPMQPCAPMPTAYADPYSVPMKPLQQQQPQQPSALPAPVDVNEEKKFKCSYPGCTKRYKNSQGVRYHMRMSHQQQNQPSSGETSTGRATPISGAPSPGQNSAEKPPSKNSQKPYKCQFCTKRYKTTSGLQNHVQSSHQRIVQPPSVDPSTISLNDNYQSPSYVAQPSSVSPSQNPSVMSQQQYLVQNQQMPNAGELNPGVTVRTALQNQMYSQARQLISANEGGASVPSEQQMYGHRGHRAMPITSGIAVKTDGGMMSPQHQSRVPGLTVTPMPQRLISQQRMLHNGANPNSSPTAQLIRVNSMEQPHPQMHPQPPPMEQPHSAYSSPSYAPPAPVSAYGQLVQPGLMPHLDQQ